MQKESISFVPNPTNAPEVAHETEPDVGESQVDAALSTIWAVAEGHNSYERIRKMKVQLARNREVSVTPLPAPKPKTSLNLSILSCEHVRACLSPIHQELVKVFTPCTSERRVPTIFKGHFGDSASVPIEEVITVNFIPNESVATILSLEGILRSTHTVTKCMQGVCVQLHCERVSDTKAALFRLKKENRCLRQISITHYSPDRWITTEQVTFNLARYISFAIANPAMVVDDAAERKKNEKRQLVPGTHKLYPIIWLDGWKTLTSAVKCRLYDPTGAIFPCHITPPYRIVEWQGKESEVTKHSDVLSDLLIEAVGQSYMHGTMTVVLEPGFILGDHKALQILCGIPRGGHYPCPFTTCKRADMAVLPFECEHRYTILDLVYDRNQVLTHGAHEGNLARQHGRWQVDRISERPILFQDIGALQQYHIIPPMMHNSFALMKMIWKLVSMLKAPVECSRAAKNWKSTRTSSQIGLQRTTGCIEQSRSRQMVAALSNDMGECLPSELRNAFKLISQLQALYYSKRTVTDEDINLAFVGGMCCHLLSTMLIGVCRADNPKPQFETDKDTGINPCSLYYHDIVAVMPFILRYTKVPLGYLLEETFERDFINNNVALADGQRTHVIQQLILQKQAQVLLKVMTNSYSAGTKASNVKDIKEPITSVEFHDCMFSATDWLTYRDRVLEEPNQSDKESSACTDWGDCLQKTKLAFKEHLNVNDWQRIAVCIPTNNRPEQHCKLCICPRNQNQDEFVEISHHGATGSRRSERMATRRTDARG